MKEVNHARLFKCEERMLRLKREREDVSAKEMRSENNRERERQQMGWRKG